MELMYKGNKVTSEIPDASTTAKGLVQIGEGISIDNGVISAKPGKEISAGDGMTVTSEEGTVTVGLSKEVMDQLTDAVTTEEADGKYLPIKNPNAVGILQVSTGAGSSRSSIRLTNAETANRLYFSTLTTSINIWAGDTDSTVNNPDVVMGCLADPILSHDAATKNYVDTIVGSIQTALDSILNS